MRYELTKELECGNSIIDGEHRRLLQAVNELMDACSRGQGRTSLEPTLKFLLNYVEQHFSHEEQLQRRSNYPGLLAHQKFHEEYKSKLRIIAEKIPPAGSSIADLAALNQHIALLVSHIKSEDKKLGQFLKQ